MDHLWIDVLGAAAVLVSLMVAIGERRLRHRSDKQLSKAIRGPRLVSTATVARDDTVEAVRPLVETAKTMAAPGRRKRMTVIAEYMKSHRGASFREASAAIEQVLKEKQK